MSGPSIVKVVLVIIWAFSGHQCQNTTSPLSRDLTTSAFPGTDLLSRANETKASRPLPGHSTLSPNRELLVSCTVDNIQNTGPLLSLTTEYYIQPEGHFLTGRREIFDAPQSTIVSGIVPGYPSPPPSHAPPSDTVSNADSGVEDPTGLEPLATRYIRTSDVQYSDRTKSAMPFGIMTSLDIPSSVHQSGQQPIASLHQSINTLSVLEPVIAASGITPRVASVAYVTKGPMSSRVEDVPMSLPSVGFSSHDLPQKLSTVFTESTQTQAHHPVQASFSAADKTFPTVSLGHFTQLDQISPIVSWYSYVSTFALQPLPYIATQYLHSGEIFGDIVSLKVTTQEQLVYLSLRPQLHTANTSDTSTFTVLTSSFSQFIDASSDMSSEIDTRHVSSGIHDPFITGSLSFEATDLAQSNNSLNSMDEISLFSEKDSTIDVRQTPTEDFRVDSTQSVMGRSEDLVVIIFQSRPVFETSDMIFEPSSNIIVGSVTDTQIYGELLSYTPVKDSDNSIAPTLSMDLYESPLISPGKMLTDTRDEDISSLIESIELVSLSASSMPVRDTIVSTFTPSEDLLESFVVSSNYDDFQHGDSLQPSLLPSLFTDPDVLSRDQDSLIIVTSFEITQDSGAVLEPTYHSSFPGEEKLPKYTSVPSFVGEFISPSFVSGEDSSKLLPSQINPVQKQSSQIDSLYIVSKTLLTIPPFGGDVVNILIFFDGECDIIAKKGEAFTEVKDWLLQFIGTLSHKLSVPYISISKVQCKPNYLNVKISNTRKAALIKALEKKFLTDKGKKSLSICSYGQCFVHFTRFEVLKKLLKTSSSTDSDLVTLITLSVAGFICLVLLVIGVIVWSRELCRSKAHTGFYFSDAGVPHNVYKTEKVPLKNFHLHKPVHKTMEMLEHEAEEDLEEAYADELMLRGLENPVFSEGVATPVQDYFRAYETLDESFKVEHEASIISEERRMSAMAGTTVFSAACRDWGKLNHGGITSDASASYGRVFGVLGLNKPKNDASDLYAVPHKEKRKSKQVSEAGRSSRTSPAHVSYNVARKSRPQARGSVPAVWPEQSLRDPPARYHSRRRKTSPAVWPLYTGNYRGSPPLEPPSRYNDRRRSTSPATYGPLEPLLLPQPEQYVMETRDWDYSSPGIENQFFYLNESSDSVLI